MASLPLYKRLFIIDPHDASDVDLLSVLLSGSTGSASPREVAERLLMEAGGRLTLIDNLGVAQGAGVQGAAYARLVAAGELYRRMATRKLSANDTIVSAEEAVAHVRAMGLENYETLVALYLNRAHHVLGRRTLTQGNDAHTIVDPRQVFRPAIALGASSVILFHNHPSGRPEASSSDVEVTQRCTDAGKTLGVELLDHIVVTPGSYVSLREQGLMPARSHVGPAFV